MFVAAHEWTLPGDAAADTADTADTAAVPRHLATPPNTDRTRQLYDQLAGGPPDDTVRRAAIAFVRQALHRSQADESGLPGSPADLAGWMRQSAQRAGDNYRDYLQARQAGAPRR